jgi:hypothetical protein
MKRAAILVVALALSACATAPEPKIVTKEVKVPVPVSCVPKELPAAPTYADGALRPTTPPDERYRLTAQANAERRARLALTEPILALCR